MLNISVLYAFYDKYIIMKKEVFIALEDFKLNQATIYGTKLAKQLDRYVYLFGVVKVPVSTPPVIIDGSILQNTVSLQIQDLKDKAKRDLEDLVAKLKIIHPNIYADTSTGFKEPTVIDETKKKNPYLMVIEGSSELTTMHEWFGTHETRLAESTTVPTLIVPKGFSWKPIRNILYLMDKDSENIENMRYLIELAAIFKAKISVITIVNNENEAADEKHQQIVTSLCTSLNCTDFTFQRVFTEGAAEAIEEILIQTAADWLTFEHKDRSFFERVFGDYNTEHLILKSKSPVLVF